MSKKIQINPLADNPDDLIHELAKFFDSLFTSAVSDKNFTATEFAELTTLCMKLIVN